MDIPLASEARNLAAQNSAELKAWRKARVAEGLKSDEARLAEIGRLIQAAVKHGLHATRIPIPSVKVRGQLANLGYSLHVEGSARGSWDCTLSWAPSQGAVRIHEVFGARDGYE